MTPTATPDEAAVPRDEGGTAQETSADAIFAPVGSGNVYEETVERLAAAIKLGAVRVGERLPAERVLAPRLGVSRVTLREAIRALEQAGSVERRRGRSGGTYVLAQPRSTASERQARKIAKQMGGDLLDALGFRRVLEPGAAALAAERVRDGKSNGSEGLEELAAIAAAAGAETYRAADSQLHLAIANLASCPPLSRAIADLQLKLTDLLASIPRLDPAIKHANAQHTAIVGAILRGDPEAARHEMDEHVNATANLLRGFLT